MWKFLKKSKSHKSFEDKKKEDKEFVKSLVKLGFVSEELSKSVEREHAYARIRRPHALLVDLLFKKGLISRTQAEIAFERIGVHYRFCPSCLQKYSLKFIREGRHISCTHCHYVFEVTDNVLKADTKTLKKAGQLVIRPKNPTIEEHPSGE